MIDEPEADHREIERRLDVAGEAIAAVRSAGDGDAWLGAGVALNRRFNELVAVYLAHLAREEVTILPATWEHFYDAELGAMQGAIVASIPPDRYGEWLTWMLRGLSRPELVGMFAGARASAPPPALEGMTRLAEATLGQARWAWLSRLPPQPGREAPGGQREGKKHEHADHEKRRRAAQDPVL